MKKLYTAEEIEIGKYYNSGSGHILKLIKRTGKKVESYPNAFSNVYIFERITLFNDVVLKSIGEFSFNPKYKKFSSLDKKEIKELIQQKEKDIKFLKKILL